MSRRRIKLIVFLLILLLLSGLGSWVGQLMNIQIWPHSAEQVDIAITMLFLAYMVCMILPFMPAIELGLLLLMMLDIQGIAFLYVITLIALTISFWLGRLVPIQLLIRVFDFLHLDRAGQWLHEVSLLDERERMNGLINQAPKRVIPFMLKHRYWVIAIALNLPGNAIIGGGGGIGMLSGMSRLLSYRHYLITIAIAVMPLPLLFIIKQWLS